MPQIDLTNVNAKKWFTFKQLITSTGQQFDVGMAAYYRNRWWYLKGFVEMKIESQGYAGAWLHSLEAVAKLDKFLPVKCLRESSLTQRILCKFEELMELYPLRQTWASTAIIEDNKVQKTDSTPTTYFLCKYY